MLLKTSKRKIKKEYKIVFILILLLILFLFIRNITKDYSISYKLNGYNITEIVKDKTINIIVEKDNIEYKYLLFSKRKAKRKIVDKIKEEQIEGYTCLTPLIDKIKTYTVCYKDNEFITKELASGSLKVSSSNKDLEYYGLNDNEYLLVWKYDGFYYYNGINEEEIKLFDKNRYNNDLMIEIDKYLLFPKYDEEYTFNSFVLLDITTKKTYEIDSNNTISIDSYYAGTYKDNIYLFDNKSENLYKINYRKKNISLVGSNIKGYEKVVNNKVVDASLKEYKTEKITFFSKEESPIIVDNNIISYNYFKIKYAAKAKKVYNKGFDIYYINEDNIYKYSLENTKNILHYFELNFNTNNNVFIYQK